ncbi:hypothetical protein [Capnocytophaga canis]|uniref:hypothetical protein n=1 Tax=Capnocytophaga canis TaxID=1848903 RepID=UPI0037D880F7
MNIQEITLPKFLLAEEPMEDLNRFVYIYSPHYMSLIMVVEEYSQIMILNTENENKIQKLFQYSGKEQFRLILLQNNVEATGGIFSPVITTDEFLEEAWEWHRNYLVWEDNNIDNKEKGRWN